MSNTTVGVFASAFDDVGRILCVRQRYASERWTTPGGRLEDGEDPRFGVLRELHEETGYRGTVVGFSGTYIALFKSPMDVVLCFRVALEQRDAWQPNGEISECMFFSRSDLPNHMSYNTRVRILDAFEKKDGVLRLFPTSETLADETLSYLGT
jgi:8-oxo-dGTP pyrophosphatase MutT (NUDIX family)